MDKNQIREIIAKRAAKEIKNGDVVNLGIGLPTIIPNYLPNDVFVTFQSENGMLGMGASPEAGKENPYWTNAGGSFITAISGASTFDSATSFAIIRGRHVDISILGALQVDENGNLANWMIPGKKTPGMGGAMDLLSGTRKVILAMEHLAGANKKILKQCNLPLTAVGKVNVIITEMGFMEIAKDGIILREIHPEFSVEDVQNATEATLIIDKNLKKMEIN
jgi:acetate CoA/acetoacetate CoA-transferase beta subunit